MKYYTDDQIRAILKKDLEDLKSGRLKTHPHTDTRILVEESIRVAQQRKKKEKHATRKNVPIPA